MEDDNKFEFLDNFFDYMRELRDNEPKPIANLINPTEYYKFLKDIAIIKRRFKNQDEVDFHCEVDFEFNTAMFMVESYCFDFPISFNICEGLEKAKSFNILHLVEDSVRITFYFDDLFINVY